MKMVTAPFAQDLVVTPVSRWPTTLREDSVRRILGTPVSDRITRRGGVERPRASVLMVTFNGLVFTRLCLESLLSAESVIPFEVVVVDNGSTDGTPRYLLELASIDQRVHVQQSAANAGFAAASNRAAALSRGEIIVFLNNDTIPVNGWLDRLTAHLDRHEVGLVGAVTNRAGNEAEIEAPYQTYGEIARFADCQSRAHRGDLFEIRTATMFCAAMRREVWDQVGPLDERFEIGLFEDDDLSMRVREAGFLVGCAEDVFVHHFGQASIGQLALTGAYGALFHANRQRWEAKWGVPWVPYAKRPTPEYQALVQRLRQFVCESVPVGATVLVMSKGDEQLLELDGRHGWHFPQDEDGAYAGHHPPDSDACITELQRLRARGAEFLVIPDTSRWWLEHYTRFAEYLETNYRRLGNQLAGGVIFPLSNPTTYHVSDGAV